MKFTTASTLLACAASVAAHARVFQISVNGVEQGSGAGKYIRQPPSNSPVKVLSSPDVRCNVNGGAAASTSVKVPAGATVTPEWFHDNKGDDIIDGTHVGPVVAYLAPAASNGAGNVWTKISEDGFDGSQWAVTRLKNNGGRHDIAIPSTLAAGEYILRVEILALHESDTLESKNALRGIQLYPSCSQITVTGSGSVTLPAGVAFPGEYTDATPGIFFNVYGADPKTYVIPGPPVWDGKTGGSAPALVTSAAPAPAPTTIVAPVPVTSVAAPAPVTSVVAPAPEVTSVVVPVPEVSSVVAPIPEVTSVVVPVPEVTSAAPAPEITSAAPAPEVTTVSSVISAIASSISSVIAAPPAPTAGVITDANVCMNNMNKCIDATQPNPTWDTCYAIKDACLVNAKYSRRALHSARLARSYY